MRLVRTVLMIPAFSIMAFAQQAPILFEGARLVNGDGRVVENSAFIIQGGKFTVVGRKGAVKAPTGAARVNLTGKTVIPALIDAHVHLGWWIAKTNQIGAGTYSRENLIDHLQRVAYYGVAAVQSMGIDPGEIGYQIRANPPPGAALFRLAGRGIAMPRAGPGRTYWQPVAYGVTTEAEARADVRTLGQKKADLVKIWVDDRNGTVPKLRPELYRAIIDEAHRNGLRVAAHVYYLADAKELLRSGVDILAHLVRDRDADDELIALLKQHPNVYAVSTLPDRETTEADLNFAGETYPAAQIKRMRAEPAAIRADDAKKAREAYGIQARNLAKFQAAGVKIVLGTDSSTAVGWNVHQEMTDMVIAGMKPRDVLTAATKTAAEMLKLDQLGSVAAGKSADFIVLNANPLDDINNTRKIADVYERGNKLDRAAMRAGFTAE